MYSPATRLLTALELLQARSRVSTAVLADRLEVNARSVRRYITMLQNMGVPVEAERGRYGGYRLRPGFKLPPLMLTEDEALAVTLGLLSARQVGLAGALPAVEGALAKIERVLPVALRERVQAVQETVALDLASPVATPMSPHLMTFSLAAHQSRRVRMRYRGSDGGETQRALDCFGLVYREGRWYAVGYCHLRQAMRTFRLDRVVEVEVSGEEFVWPAGFDSLAYVLQAFAAIPDMWLVEVMVRAPLEQIRWSVPPSFATLDEQSDGVLLRAYERDLDHAAHFLVGLACPVEVLQPPELRDALRRLAEQIAAMARIPSP
jgi:predicted DNA-binding transcriptional regulator YafY